jgi:hypothetical protein
MTCGGLCGALLAAEGGAAAPLGPGEGGMARRRLTVGALPHRIGSVRIDRLGSLFAVRCPADLDPLMREAGGIWEPDSRRWLLVGSRLVQLAPTLRRKTEPLFRWAGINLDW